MKRIQQTPGAMFIAEVSSNHQRDLQRALRFIDESARVGCDAVKFQLFRLEEMFSPEVLEARPAVRKRKDWELPVAFLPELSARCREKDIAFSCTPFYLDAVAELHPYVDFYKVASYELLWDDLLRTCAQTGKPLVLSTGMATVAEIDHAVETVVAAGCRDLTLLHCVSGYPAPIDQCNLAAIQTLRERYAQAPVGIGWSDHSVSPDVVLRAIRHWGASTIEFHLDLEGDGDEFKTGHCWLPDQIQAVIAQARTAAGTTGGEAGSGSLLPMDGNGVKEPVPAELPDREWRADPSDGLRPMLSMRNKLKVR